MKAIRVHRHGGLEALVYEDAPRPDLKEGQVLVRVKAAGVGPWDALVRSGASKLDQPLPLIPGSDIAGVVEETGPGVRAFQPGDAVFGSTNPLFTGGYAEYAAADAAMIARKPHRLSDIEAAVVPVVAVTAWQMVFDYGKVEAGARVLVHGGAGSVGSCAVQLASEAGAEVIATAFAKDLDYVRALGAGRVIDASAAGFEAEIKEIDVVIDTVGGDTQARSFSVLKRGGVLVSSVAPPDPETAERHGIHGVFFYVAVATDLLTKIAERIDAGRLKVLVGEVLPLSEARLAHEMLAGKPHGRGKIVLSIA